MENVIKELKLELGGKKINLTVKQAKKLKDALDELFGEKVIKEIIREDHWRYPWHWHWELHQPSTGDSLIWYSDNANVRCSYSADSGAATLKVA